MAGDEILSSRAERCIRAGSQALAKWEEEDGEDYREAVIIVLRTVLEAIEEFPGHGPADDWPKVLRLDPEALSAVLSRMESRREINSTYSTVDEGLIRKILRQTLAFRK